MTRWSMDDVSLLGNKLHFYSRNCSQRVFSSVVGHSEVGQPNLAAFAPAHCSDASLHQLPHKNFALHGAVPE